MCTDSRAIGGHQDSDNFLTFFCAVETFFFFFLFSFFIFLILCLILTLHGITQLSPAFDKYWLLLGGVVAKAGETISKVACMLPKTEEEFLNCIKN